MAIKVKYLEQISEIPPGSLYGALQDCGVEPTYNLRKMVDVLEAYKAGWYIRFPNGVEVWGDVE